MIQQNINRLIKGIILYLLFFTQILYADISFDKDDNMYYETPKQNYRIDELHIQNNTYYVQVKGKWLIFYDTTLIGKFGYTSLVVTKHGLLGKNKTYTLLSNDLKLLQDNLMWASINDYGIIIKGMGEVIKNRMTETGLSSNDVLHHNLAGFDGLTRPRFSMGLNALQLQLRCMVKQVQTRTRLML